MSMFTSVMTLLKNGLIAVGGVIAVWGAVSMGMSMRDHNGPGIQNGILGIVGGGIIIAAAAFLSGITL